MFNLFLSVLSGVLLALAFPKPEINFLAWFGFIFLLFSIKRSSTYRKTFLLSYLCGLIFFGIVVYWAVYVTFIGAIVLIFYLALYFGVFGLGLRWVENSFRNPLFKILLISSLWVGLEFVRSHLFTGFGWALLGYSQYMHIKLIQVADMTGVYGLSFLIIFVNAALFYMLKIRHIPSSQNVSEASFRGSNEKLKSFVQRGLPIFLAGILIFACLTYGNVRIKQFETRKEKILKVSIIQGNIDQELKWDSTLSTLILNKYEKLSCMAAFEKPDIIIWPETSLPGYLDEEGLRKKIDKLSTSLAAPFLIGAPRFSPDTDEYFNSAALFKGVGEPIIIYDKVHLVPFGEYMPLGPLFSPLTLIYPIADFSKGKDYVLFKVKGIKFGTLICFEDIFSDLVRDFVRKGADFMVNITNDAWFKKSSAAYQHNQCLVFRAVENKVSVARVGNTGPSLFIEPTGRIEKRLINQYGQDLFIDGFLTTNLLRGLKETFFTKFGDIFAYMCIIFFAMGCFVKFRRQD